MAGDTSTKRTPHHERADALETLMFFVRGASRVLEEREGARLWIVDHNMKPTNEGWPTLDADAMLKLGRLTEDLCREHARKHPGHVEHEPDAARGDVWSAAVEWVDACDCPCAACGRLAARVDAALAGEPKTTRGRDQCDRATVAEGEKRDENETLGDAGRGGVVAAGPVERGRELQLLHREGSSTESLVGVPSGIWERLGPALHLLASLLRDQVTVVLTDGERHAMANEATELAAQLRRNVIQPGESIAGEVPNVLA